ncbi:MAG: saccharopine dehydrogenase NADP-binding domain-containing protein [Hahellaceae bacterium]|nr:saccharopine dehydrogenase NADP-binding domain-containing protein [Hahellaceae bacterium]
MVETIKKKRANQARPYDIILFGASSFVGQILADYLANRVPGETQLRWAIAGRSQKKLRLLQQSLGPAAAQLPVIVADAGSPESLRQMCQQARVVVSTVGPYALYGEPLIEACVENGTDYCDLTGEVQWIRRMIQSYEGRAKETGARIVHCCGFDSIPSDIGVWWLQTEALKRFAQPCQRVKMRVRAAKGEFSGGTVASMMNVAREAAANPALRKELANPYSLCVGAEQNPTRQPNVSSATFDADYGAWTAPFIMSGINTRIVQRSNFLSRAYGDAFRYDEAMLTGKGAKGWGMAQAITTALAGFLVAAALKPSRWLLERYVVPAPGEGPSPDAQKQGFYDLRMLGTTANGESLRIKIKGDQDPGYGSTAKMLGQAALCMAFDIGDELAGGFWTPSTAMGPHLFQRLNEFAGVTFEVDEAL